MSYDQLMQHAADIQQKAVQESMNRLGTGVRGAPPSYWADQRARFEKSFSDIPGLFQQFADMPDPVPSEAMSAELGRVLAVLCSGQEPKDPIDGTIYPANIVLDKVSGSASYIENWTGRAAMEFKSNFVDPFPSVVRNQFTLAAVLKAAIEANGAMWKAARNDIDQIAHKTLEALDRMGDCGKNEWTIAFTVVASVAAIAAVPLSFGASAALAPTLAVTAVGAAAQVAAAVGPDDPPADSFSGETPDAVINEMRQAISRLMQHMRDVEAKISGSLRQTHELVTNHRKYFVSPRPELAGATSSTITSPTEMGYST